MIFEVNESTYIEIDDDDVRINGVAVVTVAEISELIRALRQAQTYLRRVSDDPENVDG